MPKATDTSASEEYCRGFVDKHGQWNNGFYCPRWGGPDRQYCCGPEDNKYCCPKPEVEEKLHDNQVQQISLLIGLAIGSLILVIGTAVLSCFFCHCCWAYKRRKRLQNPPQLPAYPGLSRDSSDPVNYAMCPHGTIFPEFMVSAPQYPNEAPPPYPGDEPALRLADKQSMTSPAVCYAQDRHRETNVDSGHGSPRHLSDVLLVAVDTGQRAERTNFERHRRDVGDAEPNGPRPTSGRSGEPSTSLQSASYGGQTAKHVIRGARTPTNQRHQSHAYLSKNLAEQRFDGRNRQSSDSDMST